MNTLGAFEAVSALLGAILIGVFMVGLLEHRNRTILKMGMDSAAVIVLFALGAILLAGIASHDHLDGRKSRNGDPPR